jgi:hypothetical protein
VVVEEAPSGAGRSTRRRRRYFVEIDGTPIVVESEAEALALLDQQAEKAERAVAKAEQRAIVRARVTGTAPKLTRPRKLPSVKLPPALRKQIGNPVEERIKAALIEAEIRAYMAWEAEQDDEEALFALVA